MKFIATLLAALVVVMIPVTASASPKCGPNGICPDPKPCTTTQKYTVCLRY